MEDSFVVVEDFASDPMQNGTSHNRIAENIDKKSTSSVTSSKDQTESLDSIQNDTAQDSVAKKVDIESTSPVTSSKSHSESAYEFMDSYSKVNKVVKMLTNKNKDTIKNAKSIAKEDIIANRPGPKLAQILADPDNTNVHISRNQSADRNYASDTAEMNNLVNILTVKTGRFVENAKQDNQIEAIRDLDQKKRLAMIAQASFEDVKNSYNYSNIDADVDYTNLGPDEAFKIINETKHDALCHLVHEKETEAQIILKDLKSNKKHFMDAIFD
jgi:hypothetical protein